MGPSLMLMHTQLSHTCTGVHALTHLQQVVGPARQKGYKARKHHF